ncbi:MAG: YceI family protein [Planctomycetes bacterium]|nr:YceI family protein [Planctomycetota bacterium]
MTTRPALEGSSLTVWTYKEGLLSKVAHDLCIRAADWQAEARRDGRRVEVEVVVPVRGLRVQGQVKDGAVLPLSEKDHREIEGNLASRHVLDADRFPEVRFTGAGDLPEGGGRATITGQLTIHGTTRPLTLAVDVREAGDRVVVTGEARVRQTDFGVKPYSALLGALKVQDEVRVSWEVALSA